MSRRKKAVLNGCGGKGQEFWKILLSCDWNGYDSLQIFNEFVDLMFCSLAHGKVEYESRLLFSRNQEEKREIAVQAMKMLGEEMEAEPYRDLLGRLHQELASPSGRQALASFYTPDDICRLTAQLGTDIAEMREKIARGETVTLCEPSCGSGRMILAVAEQLDDCRMGLRVTCTDIELIACKMAFVNLSLWGIPAEVLHGDSLQLKIWNGWKTMPLLLMEAREKIGRELKERYWKEMELEESQEAAGGKGRKEAK